MLEQKRGNKNGGRVIKGEYLTLQSILTALYTRIDLVYLLNGSSTPTGLFNAKI